MTNAEKLVRAQRIEELAKILHESGREAVEAGNVYAVPSDRKPFCEWDDLPEPAKEGRRMMARYLRKRAVTVCRYLGIS